jgi:hypothetical protein
LDLAFPAIPWSVSVSLLSLSGMACLTYTC